MTEERGSYVAAKTEEPTFAGELDAILADVRAMLLAKRHDYGPGNLIEFGEFGILVRQGDKYHRLRNLLRSGAAPAYESTYDTWQDMVGYAVLALMLRRCGPEAFAALPLGMAEEGT